MGMAASQARFLGLTARKSNVEFQGQQINQERTALSNEVMGLQSKYSELTAPIPPSKTDYTKTTYTFDASTTNYEIDNFSKINDGEYAGYYNVSLKKETETPTAYVNKVNDAVITAEKNSDDGSYSYLNFSLGTQNYTYDAQNPDASTITKITDNYSSYNGLETIMKKYGLTDGTFYSYTNNGVTYYTSENDLNNTEFSLVEGKNMYYGAYSFDYTANNKSYVAETAIAALNQTSSGRLSSIQVVSSEDEDLIGKTFSITTTSTSDEDGYTDALNEYNYQHDLYEKQIQDLNSQIEKIQTEDRSLEIKLKQLDTEEKALSTEMESISKVIENTIKSVFQTYSS